MYLGSFITPNTSCCHGSNTFGINIEGSGLTLFISFPICNSLSFVLLSRSTSSFALFFNKLSKWRLLIH